MKKYALITGASGLIGSEMVRDFLSSGYHVMGLDKRANADLAHPDYTFIKCDLTNEAAVKAAFSKLKALHVLINNGARATPTNKPIEKLSLKEWSQGIENNLTSYFLTTRAAIKLLKKSQGSIINISSTRQQMSEPNTEIYTTTKGGITSLTRALAISLAHEVRVNTISPGWIAGPSETFKKEDHLQHPAGRVGRPSDISKLCLYLAGEEAGFITGQDFVVDGGMTVKMIYQG